MFFFFPFQIRSLELNQPDTGCKREDNLFKTHIDNSYKQARQQYIQRREQLVGFRKEVDR